MICFEIYLKELCNNKMLPKILDFALGCFEITCNKK